MKIWTSSRTREKKRYAVRMAAGFAGIMALAVVLIATGAVLIHAMDWPRALSFLLLCLAVAVLSLSLISLLCRRVLRDALVFILDDNGRLFAADGRRLVQYSGPALHSHAARKVEYRLTEIRRMARTNVLPAGAVEILDVERIRERAHSRVLVCLARYGDGRTGRRAIVFADGYRDEKHLLRELEQRQRSVETAERQRFWRSE